MNRNKDARSQNRDRKNFTGNTQGSRAPRNYGDDRKPSNARGSQGSYGKKSSASGYGKREGSFVKRERPYTNREDRGERRSFTEQRERRTEYRKPRNEQPSVEKEAASIRLESDAMEQRQEEGLYTLEGKNAIWEALKAGRVLDRLLIAQGTEESGIAPLLAVARRGQTRIERVPKAMLDKYSLRGKHQGIIAFLPAMEYADFNETIQAALQENPTPLVMILDEIQDPHNLGAIIRSAYCSGAACVIVPQHRSCGLTATVAKASAGAIHHIPVCRVTNLAHAIHELQEKGFRVFGADMDGQNCFETDFTGTHVGLVIGNEGEGIRRLVKEACDASVSIPLIGDIDSLNASVAAGILMYEVLRQSSFAE